MTVSTDRGTAMTIDAIVLTAYQLAGLLPPTATLDPSRGAFGRTILNTILSEMATDGVSARWVDFYNLTLVSGTYKYSMPEYVVEVIGNGAYIAASETNITQAASEFAVTEISREEWQNIGTKSTTGWTSWYYQHEGPGDYIKQVYLWPIPDEAATIRFQVQVQPYDSLTGAATLDLKTYWMQYILWELAHQFAMASSLPENRVSQLKARGRETREKARGLASGAIPGQMTMDHQTPWSRR